MNEILNVETFFAFWVFIASLCIGSFLNVVILRGLSGESIVFPASKCPSCANKLKWWMNIPVLSYIFLKGKCGFCKKNISIQYPIVEFFVGVLFLAVYLKFGITLQTLFYIIAAGLLVVMSVTDIKESVILDIHAYILIVAGLVYNLVHSGWNGLWYAFLGALAGFLVYEILARLGYFVCGQRAFGEGDSLIAAGIGAYFGTKLMFVSVILSVLVMAIFTLPYFFVYSYKAGKKRTCAALLISVFLMAGSYFVSKFDFIRTFAGSIVFLCAVMVLTIWCVKQILSDMKKKDEDGNNSFCMLPFGPAMAISFLIIMFFENSVLKMAGFLFGQVL